MLLRLQARSNTHARLPGSPASTLLEGWRQQWPLRSPQPLLSVILDRESSNASHHGNLRVVLVGDTEPQ
ncbi:hypothetical protein SKAU_G00347060 [Synaphobranchus kaupii]|uniref:Uncharacterized protein n=1 Tax=Synaphobranchus kaupii TaxID=118154 RepID=A0A9Q1EJQ9_SYNKA|nr:hypothetical protein SKAU_G00347060 [Synaphobranchus kaupii]